jgi:hypothetical protein
MVSSKFQGCNFCPIILQMYLYVEKSNIGKVDREVKGAEKRLGEKVTRRRGERGTDKETGRLGDRLYNDHCNE